MKKIFKNLGLLFSGVLLICSLAACGNSSSNRDSDNVQKPEVNLNNEVIKYYGSDNGHFNFRSEMKRCNDNYSELTETNYFFTIIEDLEFKNYRENMFFRDLRSQIHISFNSFIPGINPSIDISEKNCCDINNFYKENYSKIPNAKIHVLIYNSSDYDENLDNKVYSPRIITSEKGMLDINNVFYNSLSEDEQKGLFVLDKFSAFMSDFLNLNNN